MRQSKGGPPSSYLDHQSSQTQIMRPGSCDLPAVILRPPARPWATTTGACLFRLAITPPLWMGDSKKTEEVQPAMGPNPTRWKCYSHPRGQLKHFKHLPQRLTASQLTRCLSLLRSMGSSCLSTKKRWHVQVTSQRAAGWVGAKAFDGLTGLGITYKRLRRGRNDGCAAPIS
jgi:hypothetical protein